MVVVRRSTAIAGGAALLLALTAAPLVAVEGFRPPTTIRTSTPTRVSSHCTPPTHLPPQIQRMPTTKTQLHAAAAVRSYKHLFRHYDDISMDCWLRCEEPVHFFQSCGYAADEFAKLQADWPDIAAKNVHDQLAPHVRFLVRAMGGGTGDLWWTTNQESVPDIVRLQVNDADDDEPCDVHDDNSAEETHQLRISERTKQVVPASFFQMRLETTVAPRHAYLTWQDGLPSGTDLLYDESKFQAFLAMSQKKTLQPFVELCNQWERTAGKTHTMEDVQAFVTAFHQGLVPACRSALHTTTACPPGRMVELLLQHGANHLEDDHHGASLLHWAAGTGNADGVRALLRAAELDGYSVDETIADDRVAKDGATPLHWAAAGVSPTGVFATGGHAEICRYLLDQANGKQLANTNTYTNNSPLEWAAWAGSLDVVKLLVEEYQADPHFCSDNGNAAHWACAGGSLEVCRYLKETCGVDFSLPNTVKGWTPLDLARSEGHGEIVEWLLSSSSYPQQGKSTPSEGNNRIDYTQYSGTEKLEALEKTMEADLQYPPTAVKVKRMESPTQLGSNLASDDLLSHLAQEKEDLDLTNQEASGENYRVKLSRPERKALERLKANTSSNNYQKSPGNRKIQNKDNNRNSSKRYDLHSTAVSQLTFESTAEDVLRAIKRAQHLHDAEDLRTIETFLLDECDVDFAYGYRGSLLSRLAVAALHMNNHELARKAIDKRRVEYRSAMLPHESGAIIRGLLRVHNVTDALEVLEDELSLPLQGTPLQADSNKERLKHRALALASIASRHYFEGEPYVSVRACRQLADMGPLVREAGLTADDIIMPWTRLIQAASQCEAGRRNGTVTSREGVNDVLPCNLVYSVLAAMTTFPSDNSDRVFEGLSNALVRRVLFLTGAVDMKGCPPADRGEAAFIGRSNVGKSSLVNMVTNRKSLAYTSKRPGKTQQFNFFAVNDKPDLEKEIKYGDDIPGQADRDSFYIVDLPGVGYAEVPQKQREAWSQFMKEYLSRRKTLKVVFHLIDSRHGATDEDKKVMKQISESLPASANYVVVLTKADKNIKGATAAGGKVSADVMNSVRAAMNSNGVGKRPVILSSANTKLGRDDLWRYLRLAAEA